jgi:hypothetical protein
MAKKPESKLTNTAIPKSGMAMGNNGGNGVLDTSTLPKPTLPQWDGWKNIDRRINA